jgi:tungstate transport system ATP-binding protein
MIDQRIPQESIFHLEEVGKTYHGRQVLEVSSLEIFRGEILVLVGPSGAGKSTLLRLLNFLEPPTRGRIIFHDTVFDGGKEMPLDLRRRVTTVFQHPMLLNRSVEENVSYGLRLRGSRGMNHLVAQTLEKVGLGELATQKAHTLSGGEAQRVALARTMVLQPEVLLMDEPTANLDPYNVGLIEKIIHDLNQEQGTTIVLVTHNVFQARRLAQRMVLMLEGKVIEASPVEDFFTHPADLRTAAFARGEMIY